MHHQRRGITAKGEQEGEGVSRSLAVGVSGEELPEGQRRAVWNRDAGCDHEARGQRQTRSQLRPGQSAARSAGEVTASTLAEDGGLATLSADNICMHFVKYAVS